MALHTTLPIHKRGVELLAIAFEINAQLPRLHKRAVGEKITHHCTEMLDRMALANATKRGERVRHIETLLSHQRALEVLLRVAFDSRWISPGLWGQAVQVLESIGAQAGGWLKRTHNDKAPAA